MFDIFTAEGVQVVTNYESVTESAYGWFAVLIEKITAMIEVGDCVEDVNAVIAKEEAKLDLVFEKSKNTLSIENETIRTGSTSFYDKLRWSITSQIKNVKNAVQEAYVSESEISHKIDIGATKAEFKKIVSVELEQAKTEVYKTSTVTSSEVTIVASKPTVQVVKGEATVVAKSTKESVKDVVIYHSVEQAQEETRKNLTCVIKNTQSKFAIWYDIFFERIRSITISAGDASYKREVEKVVEKSLEEAAVIIKESKSEFEFEYSVSKESSAEVISTVKTSQQQAIESLNNIYTIVNEQVSSIQEVVISSEVDVTEKIAVIEEQSRRKTCTALELTTESAIAVGFEGKTITWVETAQIPDSFKGVKVFAFDVIDTVVNYRASISKAWYLIVSKKKASDFAHIDVQKLIIRWYSLYLEERVKAKYSEADISVLYTALKLVLVELSIKCLFTKAELQTLCSAWLKLELFEDASASIRKIKQLEGVYAVTISHAFGIRTMMDLARNGCLCWHAQFTANMFRACTVNNGTSEEYTVVSSAGMLLALDKASELAIVSSNPTILEAAREYGAKTVLLNRFNEVSVKSEESFDVEFSALDIFSESFETFYETKVINTKVEVPVTRSWFQRVVSTVTETAESVSHAIIG